MEEPPPFPIWYRFSAISFLAAIVCPNLQETTRGVIQYPTCLVAYPHSIHLVGYVACEQAFSEDTPT